MSTNRPPTLANINLSVEVDRILSAGRARLESLRGHVAALPILKRIAGVVHHFSRAALRLEGCKPDPSRRHTFTEARRDSIAEDLWLTATVALSLLEQALRNRWQCLVDSPRPERNRLERETLLFSGDVARLVEEFLQGLDTCGLPAAEAVPPPEFLPTAEHIPLPVEAPPQTPLPPAKAPRELSDTLPDTQLLPSPPDGSRPSGTDQFDFVVPPEAWYAKEGKPPPLPE